MLANTAERVAAHTSPAVNAAIQAETDRRVRECATQGVAAIDRRIRELDGEWDVERALEANAATAVLVGVGLGTFVDRRFFALPAIVAGFLLQHALQGWCPPVPVLRRLRVRTSREIEEERNALKALRGDFQNGSPSGKADPAMALAAARR
jgi:hypothetical protein